MKFASLTLIATSLLLTDAAHALHTIGVARGGDDGGIRYIEHHEYLESGEHRVRYFNPAGGLLLSKVITYPGLPQHPDITLNDLTRDLSVTVTTNENQTVMTRATGEESPEVFNLDVTSDTIIDAGFDTYIRENWDSFETQPRQSFEFAAAGNPRLIKVTIERVDTSTTEDGEVLTHFQIVPDNFLVKLLLKRMILTYNEARQLDRYEGFTNLAVEPGQSRQVTIDFEHVEDLSQLNPAFSDYLSIQ